MLSERAKIIIPVVVIWLICAIGLFFAFKTEAHAALVQGYAEFVGTSTDTIYVPAVNSIRFPCSFGEDYGWSGLYRGTYPTPIAGPAATGGGDCATYNGDFKSSTSTHDLDNYITSGNNNGDYYMIIAKDGDGIYINFTRFAAGNWTTPIEPPEDTTTRIENWSPTEIVSTSTVDISFDYYLNSFDFPFGDYEACIDADALEGGPILLPSGITPERSIFDCVDVDRDSEETFATTTGPLQNGAWQAYAVLRDKETGASIIAKPFRFVVINTRVYEDQWYTDTGTTTPLSEACENILFLPFCALAEMFSAALRFLFAPSDNTFDRFINLKEDISAKPPFGYWPIITGAIGGITSTSTPAYVIAQMDEVQDNVFTPIKDGLAWLLWVMFAVAMWHRIKHMEI